MENNNSTKIRKGELKTYDKRYAFVTAMIHSGISENIVYYSERDNVGFNKTI